MFLWTRGGVEDRWHAPTTPGAYEWWGFEALDTGSELAFSLRISAGDPMDPEYARVLARDRAAARPDRNVLVRAVLYRKGRRVLARSFRAGAEEFAASTSSGAVRAGAASVRIEESARGRAYVVELDPGTRLTFSGPPGRPPGTGTPEASVWDLAPLDLDVSGQVETGTGSPGERLHFQGRGVHDHGFGPSSPGYLARSWAWGWAHAREYAVAWRQVLHVSGEVESLLVVDREGEPFIGETARSRPFRTRFSLMGIPYRRQWRLDAPSGAGLAVERLSTLGSSPVGMRFLSSVRFSVRDPAPRLRLVDGIGLSSVAWPRRAGVPPLRWLARARDAWTSHRTRGPAGQ
jgi:hypothetical protein